MQSFRTVEVDQKKVRLQIWDTAGQERLVKGDKGDKGDIGDKGYIQAGIRLGQIRSGLFLL